MLITAAAPQLGTPKIPAVSMQWTSTCGSTSCILPSQCTTPLQQAWRSSWAHRSACSGWLRVCTYANQSQVHRVCAIVCPCCWMCKVFRRHHPLLLYLQDIKFLKAYFQKARWSKYVRSVLFALSLILKLGRQLHVLINLSRHSQNCQKVYFVSGTSKHTMDSMFSLFSSA